MKTFFLKINFSQDNEGGKVYNLMEKANKVAHLRSTLKIHCRKMHHTHEYNLKIDQKHLIYD